METIGYFYLLLDHEYSMHMYIKQGAYRCSGPIG